MAGIIQKTKHEFGFLFMVVVFFLGAFAFSGCASMYDNDGNLTPQTVQDIQAGAEFFKGVTDSAAPNLSPVVVGGSAVVGGALALIGKAFFRRKENV